MANLEQHFSWYFRLTLPDEGISCRGLGGNEAIAESGSFASEVAQEALLVLHFIRVLTELNELLSGREHAEVDGSYFAGCSRDGFWSTSSRSDSSIESA